MSDWSTACPDWADRLMAGRSLVPDLPLYKDEAERALRIFKRLRLPDVFGTPTMGEACGPWFFPIVEAIFGSYDAETNRRMIQEAFLLVPKKNGKSSLAAAVMVVALIVNRRPSAEFLLIAPTMEIAHIAFKQAAGIIALDSELAKLFHPQRHLKMITHRESGATLQIKAADTDTITGSKSTGILVDETHEFARKAKAKEIFVEIRGALAARPDGFMVQITTQSKDQPSGVFKAELHTARDVRDGKLELPLLPVLYELPEGQEWTDPKTWSLVNPNLHRSVDQEFLRTQLLKAQREGSDTLTLLASQHFNVEIGLRLKTDGWAGAAYWETCADQSLRDLDELLRRCDVAVVGIDGGGLDDLLGLAVLGREKTTRRWLLWSHAWAHECVLERRKEIAPKLRDFEKEGTLTIIPDDSDADVQGVADIVEQVADAGLLPDESAVGVDPVGISAIVDELERREFSPDEGFDKWIVGVRQGWTLSDKIKTAERKLAARDLLHGGTALMAWAVSNCKVEPRGNAITITKQAAGSAKIDPVMALLNAVSLMTMNPEASGAGRMNDFLGDPVFA